MGKHKRKRRNKDEELYSLFKKFRKRMRERHSSSSSEIEVQDDIIQAPESVEEFQQETDLAKEATVELAPEDQLPELPATQTLQENSSESLPLDEDILSILGEDPNKKTYAEAIHKDITMRWNHIITNGLEKDSKTELLKLYPIPDNCLFLEAPKINPEIKAAVSEQVLKRDRAMEQQQNCLGQATACIGKALDILIKNKECKEVTKIVSDTGRMLFDLFHSESISRRYLLQFALNKDTKEIVTQTKVGKYIFGENLHEDLKAGKAINKTGSEMKYNQPQSSKQAKPTNLNSRGPPRKYQPQHTPRAGRQHNHRPRPVAQRWPAPQQWPAPQRWPAPQQRSGPPHKKT